METIEKLRKVVEEFLERVTGAEKGKIEAIHDIYRICLETKQWELKEGKLKLPQKELEEEPTRITSAMISCFKKL